MKKTIHALVIFFIIFMFTNYAETANKTYVLTDLHMTLSIPEELVTLTKDLNENDSKFKSLGLDGKKVLDQFNTSNVYLNAIQPNGDYEVVITMQETSASKNVGNFNKLSDMQLDEIAKEIKYSSDFKIYYNDYLIYANAGIKYVVFDLWQNVEGKIVSGIQYYTIYNGQAISISLKSYKGKISDQLKLMQKSIVDSAIVIDAFPTPTQPTSANNTNDSYFWTKIVSKVIATIIVGVVFAAISILIGFLRRKKKDKDKTENQ